MSASLSIDAGTMLPDWWKHGSAQCRGTTGLSVTFDFTAGPFTCVDVYTGAATGSFTYDVSGPNANHAQLRIQAQVPFPNRVALDPATEIYAFKINLFRSKTIGTGSCAGCSEGPVTIRLDEIQLIQSPAAGYNPVLTTPLNSNVIGWQRDPDLQSFVPAGGPAGTAVTLRGVRLAETSQVRFGSLPASFNVVADSVIDAISPVGVHTGLIRITANNGADSSAVPYYAPPQLNSFAPPQGPVGHTIVLRGVDLTGSSLVAFNGRAATFVVVSDSVIHATVPSGASDGLVTVTNPGGTDASETPFVLGPSPPLPVIHSFNPAGGVVGTLVTVHGANFAGTTGVRFGWLSAPFVEVADTIVVSTVPSWILPDPIALSTGAGSDTSDTDFVPDRQYDSHGRINLSWTDCSTAGVVNRNFACNTNAGTPFTMVGSFIAPPGITEYLGMSASLSIDAGAVLPDWWKHGSAQCRGTTGLSVNFDFTVGPFTCLDVYTGAANGSFTYNVGGPGSSNAQLRIQAQLPFANRVPLDTVTEVYAFKVNLMRSKATGFSSCGGCSEGPVTIRLDEIQLIQSAVEGYDPVLTIPLNANVITWQQAPDLQSFEPAGGPPGTGVTLRGSRFALISQIRFGALPASFNVVSDSVISATAPVGVHTGLIRITANNGADSSAVPFYAPPQLNLFAPQQGPAGHTIVLRGVDLTGANVVAFNGAAAAYVVVSDSVIHATVPEGASDGLVTVTNPGGTDTSETPFVLGPSPLLPEIQSFNPAGGIVGTLVTVHGAHFAGTTGVRFGSVSADFVEVADSVVVATVPAWVLPDPIALATGAGADTSDTDFVPDRQYDSRGRINLSWTDCGVAGVTSRSFACNTNSGAPFAIVGSFVAPPGISEYLGMSASLSIDAGTVLPDWWKHGSAQCRGTTGLSVTFDFTGGPFTCLDVYTGAASGSFTYNVGGPSSSNAQLRIQAQLPFANRVPLDTVTEVYAFKVNLMRSKATGFSSCGGCSEGPVTIRLDEIQLIQSAAPGYDPVLSTPLNGNSVVWQGGPTLPDLQLFAPAGGPAGTTVMLRGVRLAETSLVRFGALPASFSVISDSLIQALVPIGAVTGHVAVIDPAGSDVTDDPFQIGPLIAEVTPSPSPPRLDLVAVGFHLGTLTAVMSLATHEAAMLDVFDLSGRCLLRQQIEGPGLRVRETRIDKADRLQPGVYFARLRQSGAEDRLKFVLLR